MLITENITDKKVALAQLSFSLLCTGVISLCLLLVEEHKGWNQKTERKHNNWVKSLIY